MAWAAALLAVAGAGSSDRNATKQNMIPWGPLSLSGDNALQNMEDVHRFIQGIYYSRAPQAGLRVKKCAKKGSSAHSMQQPQGAFREIWEQITEGLAFLEGLALQSNPSLCFATGHRLEMCRAIEGNFSMAKQT